MLLSGAIPSAWIDQSRFCLAEIVSRPWIQSSRRADNGSRYPNNCARTIHPHMIAHASHVVDGMAYKGLDLGQEVHCKS